MERERVNEDEFLDKNELASFKLHESVNFFVREERRKVKENKQINRWPRGLIVGKSKVTIYFLEHG